MLPTAVGALQPHVLHRVEPAQPARAQQGVDGLAPMHAQPPHIDAEKAVGGGRGQERHERKRCGIEVGQRVVMPRSVCRVRQGTPTVFGLSRTVRAKYAILPVLSGTSAQMR